MVQKAKLVGQYLSLPIYSEEVILIVILLLSTRQLSRFIK